MAKRPEQRWSSASEFAQAVEDALEDSAAVTRPVTPAGERAAAAAFGPAGAASAAEAEPALAPLLNRRWTARSRPHPRAIAFGALAAAVVALAVAIIAGAGGPSHPSGATQAAGTQRAHTGAARHRARPQPHHAPAPATTTSTAASTTQPSTPSSTTPALSADALEARGHSLLMSGNAAAAVGVLRQAVAAASPSSLTYAYALYDLGASLLQSGDPRGAAVVLQRRLQIPNQTEAVRQELQNALRQLGAQVNSSGGAAPAPGGPPGQLHGHGHGRGHGGQGGQGGQGNTSD
jgi:hypothetical protein